MNYQPPGSDNSNYQPDSSNYQPDSSNYQLKADNPAGYPAVSFVVYINIYLFDDYQIIIEVAQQE